MSAKYKPQRFKGCAKVRYRDRVGALLAMAEIQKRDDPDRLSGERRAYHCPNCFGWHLTSRAK